MSESETIELSDVVYALEMAYDTVRQWKNSHPDDFLVGWACNTADGIKSQLDKVQA